MNSVASYIKNLGKSVVYSAIDKAEDMAPSSSSFIETNQDLFKEVYSSVVNFKSTIQKAKNLLGDSKLYEAADVGFKAVAEDLRTGKFYNRDREEQMAARAGGSMFDMGDMDISIDSGFDESSFGVEDTASIAAGDKYVGDRISSSTRKSAELVSDTVLRSSKYVVDSQRASTNLLYVQNEKLLNNLRFSIQDVVSGVHNLHQFNTSTMQTHAENSKKYFETTTKLMQEQTAILKEMVEMQRNDYKERQDMKNRGNREENRKMRFDDIVDAKGMPNIKEYFKLVGQNFQSTMAEKGMSMPDMGGDGNMLLTFAANPLRFIPDMLVGSLIAPQIKKSMKDLDKSISGIFGTMVAKMNKMAKDEDGSLLSQIFGKVFGVRDNVKTSIDTSKYEKGPVPFDGLVKKSIVEVMPTYLRQIVALLSGKPEKAYNFQSGRWEEIAGVKKNFDNIRRDSVRGAFSDMDEYIAKHNSGLSFTNRRDKEQYYKDLENVLKKIYSDGGFFDINRPKDGDYLDYGVSSEMNMKIIRKMFNRLPKSAVMQMGMNVQNARSRENRMVEDLQKEGNSLYNILFDNSGIDTHLKKDSNGVITGMNGGILDSLDITKKEDNMGKNIFYYLQNVYKELTYIRKFGSGIGGPSAFKSDRVQIDDRFNTEFRNKSRLASKRIPTLDEVSEITNTAKKTYNQSKREEEIRLDQRYNENEERRRTRASERNQPLALIDYSRNDKDILTSAAVNFRETAGRIERDELDQEYEDMPFLYRMLDEEARSTRERNKEILERGVKHDDSFINKLLKAGTLGEKYAVIRDGLDNLMSSPSLVLTKMITKADENIYSFFYGNETGVKDERGNKIRGFFNRMVFEMKKTFQKVNDWIDTSVLKPLKDRLGIDSFGGAIKNFFVGEKGILTPSIEATKDLFKKAFGEIKTSMSTAYKPLFDLVKGEGVEENNPIIKKVSEMTDAEKNVRKNAIIDSLDVSEDELFKSYIEKTIRNESKNPKTEKGRLNLLNKLNSKFGNISAKQNEIKRAMDSYKETDLDISNNKKREELQQELNSLKSVLGIDNNINVSDLLTKNNLSDKEKLILERIQRPEFSGLFNNITSIEKQIPNLMSQRDRLGMSYNKLQSSKESIYRQLGVDKDTLRNNYDYTRHLRARAAKYSSNMSSLDEDRLAEKDMAIQAYRDYMEINGKPVKSKKQQTKDIEERYVGLLDKLKRRYKTEDPVGLLNSLVKLEEFNLGRVDNEESKNRIASKLGAKKNILNLANRAQTQLENSTKARLQQMYALIGVEGSASIDKLMKEKNISELNNLTVHDLLKFENTNVGKNAIGGINGNFKSGKIEDFIRDNNIQAVGDQNRIANVVKLMSGNKNIDETANHGLLSKEDIDERALAIEEELAATEKESAQLLSSMNKTISDKLVSGVYEISKKLDGVISAISGISVQSHAYGARQVKKSGLTAISEGELIVPSEMNPFNPNRDSVNKDQEVKNERNIKKGFAKSLVDNIYNSIDENAYGSIGKPNALFQGYDNLKSGLLQVSDRLFGGDQTKFKAAVEDVTDKVKTYLPKGVAGGILGGTIGLATGIFSPLLAAVGGSAISIASNSDKMQNWLFGEKIVDKEGNETGDRKGGVFSKETQAVFKKYLPDMKTYGIAGTVTGLLTPFGPLGGLMIGSAIAYAKNNERMKEMFFGNEDGLINEKRRKLIADAFPNVAISTVGTMFLGPFGLLGNAALGTGIGLLSTTDEFKDFVLGKAGQDGKREGGLVGALKINVVDPLAEFSKGLRDSIIGFVEKDIVNPLKKAIQPIGRDIKDAIGWTFNSIGNFVNNMFKTTLGVPLSALVNDHIINPVKRMSSFIFKMVTKPAKAVISAPFKAIGAYGDMRRASHIKSGRADYMTADERLEFRRKKGIKGDNMFDFDTLISNASNADLNEIYQVMGTLRGGTKFLDNEEQKAITDLGTTLSGKMNAGQGRDRILKLLHAGKVEEAQKLIYKSNLGYKDKKEISKMVQDKMENLRKIRYQKTNYSGERSELFTKLSEDYGLKGIGDNNLDRYLGLLEHEKVTKIGQENEYNQGDKQFKAITDTLDNNSREIIDYFRKALDLLQGIKDGTNAITDEQKEQNDILEGRTDKARDKYSAISEIKLRNRTKKIEGIYGSNSLDENSKMSLVDNEDRFDGLRKLGNIGYKFKDVNKLLSLKQKDYQRLTQLAFMGYDISNYDNITKLSDKEYSNVLRMSKLGYKFTDLDKIAKMDDDTIGYVEEMFKAGFSHENMSLDNMIKAKGKRAQFLADPQKFQQAGAQFGQKDIREDTLAYLGKNKGNSNDKREEVHMTEDGPVTYVRTNDGSMEPAKTKDNQEILAKKEERDRTQKGILAGITNMSSNITGWFKDTLGLGKDKKEEEPWWQKLIKTLGAGGLIMGALSILPDIKKSIEDGTNIVSASIGAMTTKILQGIGWAKKKLAITGDDEESMGVRAAGAATRMAARGVKPSQLVPGFVAPSLKGKLQLVESGVAKAGTWLGSNLIPTENIKNTYNLGKGVVDRFLTGLSESSSGIGVVGNIAESAEEAAESPRVMRILSSVKGYLQGLLGKIKPFITNKAAGNGVVKVFTELMTELGERVPKNIGKIGTKLLPVVGQVFSVIDGFGGFISGYQDCNSILGITHGATDGMKLCTGLLRSLNNLVGFGLIPEKWLMNIIIDYIGPAVGFDMSTIQNLRKESDSEVSDYNQKNGTDYSLEQYNKKVLDDKTIFERFNDSSVGKFIKEGAGEVGNGIISGISKAGTWAYDSIASLIGSITNIGGFVFDVVKTNVQFAITNDDSETDNIKPPQIDEKDPLAPIKKVLFYGIRSMLLPPTLIVKSSVWMWGQLKDLYNGVSTLGGYVMGDLKTAFDLSMKGDTGKMWETKANDGDPMSTMRNILTFVPKIPLSIIGMINGTMNYLTNETDPVVASIKTVTGSIGDSVTSLFKASIMGDYESVFSMPEDNPNAPPIVNNLAKVISVGTKLMLSPIAAVASPIGVAYRLTSSFIDTLKQNNVIDDDTIKKANDPTTSWDDYWNSGNSDESSSFSMMYLIGNKIFKMMMAPILMFKKIFQNIKDNIGNSIDDAKNSFKSTWLGKYLNMGGSDETPNAKGKYGRGNNILDVLSQKLSKILIREGVPKASDDDTGLKNDSKQIDKQSTTSSINVTQPSSAATTASIASPVTKEYKKLRDEDIPEYNRIQPDDSLDVIKAKMDAQRKQEEELNNPTSGKGKFYSQLDPRYNMKFNVNGDTVNQSMADSGCGPVSASNVISAATGRDLDPRVAAQYALDGGYKEKDGGTRPDFFKDVFNKYGLDSDVSTNKQSMLDNLRQGNPVVLMGQDNKISDKTPYGTSPHYVVGTGIDGRGNITIQDPETFTPNLKYNINDVLGKTTLGVSARSKYGRGGNPFYNNTYRNRYGLGKFGMGQAISKEKMWALANWVSEKTGIKPEFVFGQWYHESAGFTSQLAVENYNFGGMTQSEPTGDPADKQPDGSGYYMHFNSPEHWAEYYAKYIVKYDGIAGCKTVADFAQNLKNGGYYGASVDEYINGVSSGIAQIPGKYDKSLIDSSKFGVNGTKNNSGKKYGGLFGLIEQAADTYYSPIKKLLYGDDGNSSGTKGSNLGSMSTNNAAGNAKDWMSTNLKGSQITAPYGEQRSYGIHQGIDYGADTGTPIPSPVNGKIVFADNQPSGYGNVVSIKDKDGNEHIIAHMDSLQRGVGEEVKKGDIIGPVGSTGRSTGPHLHYEIQRNGVQGDSIDPSSYGVSGLGKTPLVDKMSEGKSAQLPKISTSSDREQRYGTGGVDSVNYTEILQTIVGILVTIADNTGKLDKVNQLLSQRVDANTVNTNEVEKESPSKQSAMASVKDKLSRLFSQNNASKTGMGDTFLNKDIGYIINAMDMIAKE